MILSARDMTAQEKTLARLALGDQYLVHLEYDNADDLPRARHRVQQRAVRIMKKCNRCGDAYSRHTYHGQSDKGTGFITVCVLTKIHIGEANPFHNTDKDE